MKGSFLLIEKLPNGIEVVLKENHFSKVVSLQCWIRAGSLHEQVDERGMAHVVEHMLFKGTPTRGPGEIGAIVERCGGEMNAYTTFERTVYYMNFVSQHLDLGLELLADAIFHSTFDNEELQREKEVILEEIRRGLDEPGSKLGRRLFEVAYSGSEASRPIIGFEDLVAQFDREKVLAFHRRWYQPQNMTFVIVGDFDTEKTLAKLRGLLPSSPGKIPRPSVSFPKHTFPSQPQVELIKEAYQVARIEIALPAPQLEDFDTPLIDLAAFALGQGDLGRLNLRLRDQQGVCSAVGVSGFTPQFDGIFSISAVAPLESYLDCVRALGREMGLLLSAEPVTQQEIDRARASLLADRIYRDETVEGQARSIGFGAQTQMKVHFDDIYARQIDLASPSLVEGAIKRWLQPDRAIVLGMVPQGAEITSEQINLAYSEGLREGRSQTPPHLAKEGSVHASKDQKVESLITVLALKPGLKLVYRQNKQAQQVSMVAAARGGLSLESDQDLGLHHALSRLWAEATQITPRAKFIERVESIGASLHGFSGKDSVGMAMHCLTNQTEDMLHLFSEAFLQAVFPNEQLQSFKRETLETIRSHEDSPAHCAMKTFQEILFKGTPYEFPVYGSPLMIEALEGQRLSGFYEQLMKSRQWVISAVGPQSADWFADQLSKKLATFQPDPNFHLPMVPEISANWQGKSVHLPMDREQVHIIHGYRGVSWYDPQKPIVEVLSDIMGGHGGRLFIELREKRPLAYSVSPISTYGCLPGSIGGYIATAPGKVKDAIEGMKLEFKKLTEELVTEDELLRAKAHLIGTHEMDMQKADSQAMTMALMELYDIGHDQFLRFGKQIESVTREDIKALAEKYFFNQEALTVYVGSVGHH